jgi:four helix bundle protein
MNYGEWESTVPDFIKGDSVWNCKAYRLSLFLADLAWHDATKLVSDKRAMSLADQLYRSAGGVSADVEEGYSRGSGRDRARFYEYGLGSAREARGWYYKGRHILGNEVTHHRMSLVTEIIKLLLTMIPDQRAHALREDSEIYRISPSPVALPPDACLPEDLENVPMP